SPPLLFMGEEWNAPHPFPFFCDFEEPLAGAVREGRRRELARLPEFADEAARARIPDPLALETFESAKLDWSLLSQPAHKAWLDFYRGLLALRRRVIVPRLAEAAAIRAERHLHDGPILDVQWRLADDALLQAIISLSPDDVSGGPIAPVGRLIFSTAPSAAEIIPLRNLPPWLVAWYLDTPEERG
ncbi:MAG: DUF3459 domain-containing protein, partial [Alphaproteobacteria bacterium]